MFLDTKTEAGERYVTLPGIYQIYGEKTGAETGVENTITSTTATKFIENNQLLIHRNGKTYTILGTLK